MMLDTSRMLVMMWEWRLEPGVMVVGEGGPRSREAEVEM
jgi:hypothetical protein